MPRFRALRHCRAATLAAATVMVSYSVAAADVPDEAKAPTGRIDFVGAALPPASLEVDLSQGMFRDLVGIGDAALAGVVESLLKSAEHTSEAEGTRLAAEQLAAARQVTSLASDVIHEVRVRAYEKMPEGVISQFDEQLRGEKWETILRLRKGNETVQVSLLRSGGAVRGVFIVAAGGGGLVLANVVGDISPENAKKLTSATAKIGLDSGLQPMIEAKMRPLHRRRPASPPPPPVEPVDRHGHLPGVSTPGADPAR